MRPFSRCGNSECSAIFRLWLGSMGDVGGSPRIMDGMSGSGDEGGSDHKGRISLHMHAIIPTVE